MATALIAKPAPPSEPEKQTQKAIQKRLIDPAGPYVNFLQERPGLRSYVCAPWLQPTMAGALQMLPPQAYHNCPISSVTNKVVHCSQNRTRCSVNCVNWTPEGRRCMTGDNIGQITMWNPTDFKLEQILQAHDKGIRHLTHTHNGTFFFSSDDLGIIRIYNTKLAPLHMVNAHEQSCRAVSVAPSDTKFASCSDDGCIRLWDLATSHMEKEFRGHGSDVKFVDWHPSSSLLVSSGRDGLIKIWDARDDPETACVTTLHGHKQHVNQVRWNLNGTWILSTSKDATVKVWDVRHTKREMHSWQGHARSGARADVFCATWHPIHLELLVSGGSDGSLFFWMVGQPQHVAVMEKAHENNILGVAFHPNGHMLASSSMDSNIKFWVRSRPGDPWRGALDSETGDASTYADLLAAATTGAGPGTGAAAAGGVLGVAAGGQLPGGIAVQLPGIPGLGAQGGRAASLAGVRPPTTPAHSAGAPSAAAAAAAAQSFPGPPALGGRAHPAASGPPGGLVPGLGPMQGLGPMSQGFPGPPGVPGLQGLGAQGNFGQGGGMQGIPGLVGPGGMAQAMGMMPGVRPMANQQQLHMAGLKRMRDSDADSVTGPAGQRLQLGHRGGRAFGGWGQGVAGQQQQQQQQLGLQAAGRGVYGRGLGRGFAGRGDMGQGRGAERGGRAGGFAGRVHQMRGGSTGRSGRGGYSDRPGR